MKKSLQKKIQTEGLHFYSLIESLERHFAKLATIGIQADGSISRLAFSDAESAAMAYIRAEGESFGLEGHYDGIGNLVLSMPGGHQRRILIGSHVDSVPHGGNYDGTVGVVGALEAQRQIVDECQTLDLGIDLVVWRGEEYTFNAVYKGSSAAFGCSEPQILHNVYNDQSLRDAIRMQGFDPSYVDESRPSFEPGYIDSIEAYLEMHIEQGVFLERENKDLGIVESISGDRRFLIVLEGRFDHSGATPMGMKYRNDVNLAMAYILTRLDQLGRDRLQRGHEFTQTVGIINADPEIDKKYPTVHGNSVTKVSGTGYFTLDLMGADDVFLDTYAADMHRLIWRTAKEFGVKAFIEQTDATSAVSELDDHIKARFQKAADTRGYTTMHMPSGAGHDAVVVAQAERSSRGPIPVGMLFVPCKHGISHSKDEYVTAKAVARGVEVVRDVLVEIAGEQNA